MPFSDKNKALIKNLHQLKKYGSQSTLAESWAKRTKDQKHESEWQTKAPHMKKTRISDIQKDESNTVWHHKDHSM